MPSAADIAAKLQAKGQAMTLSHASAGTFDPTTGGVTGSTTTTTTVYGITKSYRDGLINAPGSMILAGDKKAIISALTAPAVGDTLTIMTVVWVIVAIDALEPQGETLLYTCQIRRA